MLRDGLRRTVRLAIPTLLLLLALPVSATPPLSFSSSPMVPLSQDQACDVLFDQRTARPDPQGRIEVCRIDDPEIVPYTYSNGLVGNSEGFRWYVSSHFALKTDLGDKEAADALLLLETAWPLYGSLFGAIPWRCGRGPRIALVLASTRETLGQAIVDDDMHVFHLGGITQEGFATAYLYAASSYQTRYILLHETTHLYQYCLNGNTRGCYGFFVEGIADFFSSHLHDSETGRLTVNVLDRAPIHNHLAAGLEKWEGLGKPSFRELYEKGDISRGINVLLTAFLQSTPEYEQNWSLYVRGIVANRDATKAKAVSDALLDTLYGGPDALNAPFREWVEGLRPSYRLLARDFDQDGESLVAGPPASPSAPASILLPPLGQPAGPFTRDWPSSDPDGAASASTLFRMTVRTPIPPSPGQRVEIALCDPEGEPLLRCGLRSSDGGGLSDGLFSIPSASWTSGVTIDFSRASDRDHPIDILVTAKGLRPFADAPELPQETKDRLSDTTSLRPRLLSTIPGVRFTPPESHPAPLPRLSSGRRAMAARRTPLGRFETSAALSRIDHARRLLGPNAPLPLRIARNDLLARADDPANDLVTDETLLSPSYWDSLGRAIFSSRATAGQKEAALIAMADLRLETGPSPDGIEAVLFAAPPYPSSLRIDWIDGEKRRSLTRKATGPETMITLPPPSSESPACSLTATVDWLGWKIPLESRHVVACGAIPLWHVLGPFRIPGGVFTNAVFLSEDERVELQRTYERDDGSRIAWQSWRQPDGAGRRALRTTAVPYRRPIWKAMGLVDARETLPPVLHLTRLFLRQANDSIAYAALFVDSPEEQDAVLCLGVTDGIEIRHNNVPLYSDVTPREWSENNVRVPVRLTKGRNEFLLKLLHHENVWFLSGSILDGNGEPIPGLVFH